MAGRFLVHVLLISCIIFKTLQSVQPSPLYSLPIEQGKYSTSNNRMVVAEVDKPLDTVLEAVMELGGHILLLLPQKDFEKRDPPGPDLGTGRSYSGQRTANVMWGQLASNSPTGPGRRKRHSTDGGGASTFLPTDKSHFIVRRSEETLP